MKKEWTPEEQKKHRELWCEWLESGNYAQVRESLKDYVNPSESDEFGYCCLGIGCLVYKEVTGKGEWVDIMHSFRTGALEDDQKAEKEAQDGEEPIYYEPDQNDSLLPFVVRDFFGLNSTLGAYQGEIIENMTPSLIRLNDHQGYNFKAIAKVIREEPPGLIRQSKEEAIT